MLAGNRSYEKKTENLSYFIFHFINNLPNQQATRIAMEKHKTKF